MKYARMLFVLVAVSAVLTIALFYQDLRASQSAEPLSIKIEPAFTGRDAAARQLSGRVSLTATLIDAEKKAKDKIITVLVKVRGVSLDQPASKQLAAADLPQLHYRLNNGSTIATSATMVTFRDVPSGDHSIYIKLVRSNDTPLGPEETLHVAIP